jgi:ubiquinone/menaquinone biosynthesis C-methylase UbiE
VQQDVAELYSRVAPIYADQGPPFFEHAGRRLVELAQVRPGDVVLDVGTGRGAVLIPAARRAGPAGRVVGIDVASGMVACTRRSIQDLGLARASAVLMDASSLALESGPFTHALSSFAVFFFPDLACVLRELRRVLRPGGMVGFAFSRGTDPRWLWYEELLRRYGALDGLPPPVGYPSIRQPGILAAVLEEFGLAEVEEREQPAELFYATPEYWWASLWTHGSRRPLERLRPAILRRVHGEALERARTLVGPRGLPEQMTFVYVLGRKTAQA